MSCPAFSTDGPDGIAAALRIVDCMTRQATQTAFGRMFGIDGTLGRALTLLLTLYIALLAIALLTGRTRLSLTSLTPRMLGLGLVLTFATSWVAYQSVVWNLAVGAPDQLASLLAGTSGSATTAFADRLDAVFDAVGEAAQATQAAADGARAGAVTPADLLWLSALMLLLGTVGVLLVSRIALAALLAIGPLFILLALFRGTRGLFEGWLKGLVLFATVPLFAVLLGGAALAIVSPLVVGLAHAGGAVEMRGAVTMFLAAATYVALMTMVLKLATTLTAGWHLPWSTDPAATSERMASAYTTALVAPAPLAQVPQPAPASPAAGERVRHIVAGLAAAPAAEATANASGRTRAAVAAVAPTAPSVERLDDARARRLGRQLVPDRPTVAKEVLR